MKSALTLSMLVLFVYSIHGQKTPKTKNDYTDLYFGGELQYGLIDDNQIYLSMPSSSDGSFLWTKRLNSERVPIVYRTGFSLSDGAWNKGNEMLSALSYLSFYYIHAVKPSDFKHRKPIRKDTINIRATELYCYDMFIYPFNDYKGALDWALMTDRESFPTETNLRKEADQVINMDMYSQNSDSMYFYMRDKKALYVYTIDIDTMNILPIEERPGIEDPKKKTQWHEDVVYTASDFDPEFPIYKYWKSYSGEKTQFNAITDSLFFEGNYKVIMQDDQTYLFNRKYGHIYLLTDTEVIRIGTIRLTDEYPAIKGHKYIIEDRDRGSILLFAPVDWHDDIHSKPTIEVLSKQEFYERYKLGE